MAVAAWDIVIDAVAYICKSVYLKPGVEYLLEPIESVDEDTIGHIVKTLDIVRRRT